MQTSVYVKQKIYKINLVKIGLVALKIGKAEFGHFTVPIKIKKFKFKKEVGISIKSKETSSKLASYPAMKLLVPTLQAALATIGIYSYKHNSSWVASRVGVVTFKK